MRISNSRLTVKQMVIYDGFCMLGVYMVGKQTKGVPGWLNGWKSFDELDRVVLLECCERAMIQIPYGMVPSLFILNSFDSVLDI